jgi:beta-lactamase superfamily II metal-dependent hydrolase
MRVHIKAYPAKGGDCLLISFGEEEEKQTHLLVDCGYVDTVKKYLISDLKEINRRGEAIEKLVLTHIDEDHIVGARKLLKENNVERIVEIREIWHNTYRHLFGEDSGKEDKVSKRLLRQIMHKGYPRHDDDREGEKIVSAEQGTTVGALILQGKYPWNSAFDNQAVCIEQGRAVAINEYASLFLLSPNKQKLERLKTFWKEELNKYSVNYDHTNSQFYDDAFEMLLAWEKEKGLTTPKEISASKGDIHDLLEKPFDEDDTPTNGSSIAFILQIQAKKLLFLADAHPDLIVESLNEYQTEGVVMFDLIKISHHGSFGNINRELLEKMDSNRFLISTNGGRHNHPDKETIAQIIGRATDFTRELYFNYVTENSSFFDREDWMKEYRYSIYYLDRPPYSLTI